MFIGVNTSEGYRLTGHTVLHCARPRHRGNHDSEPMLSLILRFLRLVGIFPAKRKYMNLESGLRRQKGVCKLARSFVESHLASQTRFMHDSHVRQPGKQRILKVATARNDVLVTTSGLPPSLRRRYHVAYLHDRWAISAIDLECALCSGSGQCPSGETCGRCSGKGWIASCTAPA